MVLPSRMRTECVSSANVGADLVRFVVVAAGSGIFGDSGLARLRIDWAIRRSQRSCEESRQDDGEKIAHGSVGKLDIDEFGKTFIVQMRLN